MDLEYQVVVQFPIPSAVARAEDVLAIEDQLNAAVGSAAEVDGHDLTADRANVFVLTGDPDATFAAIRARLERAFPDVAYAAAWRTCCDNDDWTVLRPSEDGAFRLE